MECAICLETNDNKLKKLVNCNHVFHESCLNEWLKINPICPLCRTNVKTSFKCKKVNYFINEELYFSMENRILIFKNILKNKKYEYSLKIIKSMYYVLKDNSITFDIYFKELKKQKKIKYKFSNKNECNIVYNMIMDEMYSELNN